MSPRDVLGECRRRGISLEASLRFSPQDKMPPWLLAEVQRHKRELISLLSPPVHVLVAIHPDGYVQVFGHRQRIRVHVAHALDVQPENEEESESYFDGRLPAPYRPLHLPGYLVATGSVHHCRTVAAELDRLADMRLLRALEPSQFVPPKKASA